MGFDFQADPIQPEHDQSGRRALTFTSLSNFLKASPASSIRDSGRVDPVRGYRQSLFAFFFQDERTPEAESDFESRMRYEFAPFPRSQ